MTEMSSTVVQYSNAFQHQSPAFYLFTMQEVYDTASTYQELTGSV